MIESEYDLVTSFIEEILNNGKATMGTSATTGSGNASKTHQLIINTEMAKTKLGFEESEKGLTKKSSKKNTIPAINANFLLLYSNHFFIRLIYN